MKLYHSQTYLTEMCLSKTHEVNEIAKKNRVRTRQFTFRSDVIGHLEKEAILRDIHPDEAYDLLGVQITSASKQGSGTIHYVALARNASGQEPDGVAEAIVSKSGPLFHYEADDSQAQPTASFDNINWKFPEPIHFDENDSLNAHLYNEAAQVCTYVITVFYRLT